MMTSFVEHTRAEIARWREAEKRARAEAEIAKQRADALQETLDKWQGGPQPQSPTPAAAAPKPQMAARRPVRTKRANGHSKGARAAIGAKNALALKELRAAGTAGLTKDDLFASFRAVFGQGYSRANLRSMLVHVREKDWDGWRVIEKEGRYFLTGVAH